MSRKPFKAFLLTLIALATLPLASAGDVEKDQAKLLRRSARIVKSLEMLQIEEDSKIPANIMSKARGIIILRQYEAGVIFGAKGGFGIAMIKDQDDQWSAPAWIKTGEISGGLQLGVQTLNVVLLIMNTESLRMLEKAKFQIGVDATVTRGPTGSTFEARIGEGIDLLAYTDTEGLYAGATFEGGFLLPDRKSNQLTYGERLSVPDIVKNPQIESPEHLSKLSVLLKRIENGRPTDLD
ncbi:lipid-binding SYLF domain-containing protein [Pelagicoccus sp. SDUM812003]|uniref:lipid-binding SYLF domain-containing protein n=1 Tax=Pelagicoccus sp. SDUM812003 TaxID=3041267 RepID=UPI0028100ED4|nr:lipid-binding SYLF domain-containing protein [Pelagicoccus sp. SDUM812003]MDQ8204377.1 lipid-binding SYLF domain-containing protein [Pelagicoccus sp. SDUM812003]